MDRLSVGMDVHKEKVVMCGLPERGDTPVMRETFRGDNISGIVKRLRSLSRVWAVESCYEAGPSGYGLARVLTEAGISCRVVAPSLMPRRPGNMVKTDIRDAKELAAALRAQTLEFVRIPSCEEEEVRGLVRCREDIARQLRSFKQIVSHWLLSHGYRPEAKVNRWSPTFWRWVRGLPLPSLERMVLDHYLDVLLMLEDRRKQLESQICELADREEYRERVCRLGSLRGFSKLAAMRLIAEVMDFNRFLKASAFMKFTGLTPSEHSSSERIRRGKITKGGNSHIRHVLVEAVQRAHVSARPGRSLLKRQEGAAGEFRQIALKCLLRLYRKFWAYTKRGVPVGKVRVAMARELAGFVWALMVHPTPVLTAAA